MAVIIDGTTGIDKVKAGAVDIGDLVATGTADATTFLRGDGTWGAPAGGVTSLNGQTGAITNTGLGEIGSNIIGIKSGYYASASSFAFGSAYSSVYVARAHATASWSLMPGTWRALGGTQGYFSGINSNQHLGLFVRVS